MRDEIQRLGGSHAQRDIFARTLAACALADGRFELARDVLSERMAARPADPAPARYRLSPAGTKGGAVLWRPRVPCLLRHVRWRSREQSVGRTDHLTFEMGQERDRAGIVTPHRCPRSGAQAVRVSRVARRHLNSSQRALASPVDQFYG